MTPTEQPPPSASAGQPWDSVRMPAEDLADALHDHHERIDQMLVNVAAATGDDRRTVFWWLRRFLAAHQAAEAVFIHSPHALDAEDEEVTAHRLAEKQATEALVTRLEDVDADSAEFDCSLQQLRLAIGRHARAEELRDLPQLLDALPPHEIVQLRQALDHVDVLVSHRTGPLGERARPFTELLELATAEFRTFQRESGV